MAEIFKQGYEAPLLKNVEIDNLNESINKLTDAINDLLLITRKLRIDLDELKKVVEG